MGVLTFIIDVLSDSNNIKRGTWPESRGSVFWPLRFQAIEMTVVCVSVGRPKLSLRQCSSERGTDSLFFPWGPLDD